MPSTEPPETLHALRRAVAETLPGEEDRLISFGVASLDQALAGGLICGALHEIGPAAPLHGGAGFALALAALALGPLPSLPHQRGRDGKGAVWIQPDFAAAEAGSLYGPGLDLMGLPMERLVILRVPRPRDALWAM